MSHEDLSRLELQLREQLNSMKMNRETKRIKQRVAEAESNDKMEISVPLLPSVATQGDLNKLKVRRVITSISVI